MDTVTIICIVLIALLPIGAYVLYHYKEGNNVTEELKLFPRRLLYALLTLIIWTLYIGTGLVGIPIFRVMIKDPNREWWWIPTLLICGCAIELAAKLLSYVVDKYIKVRKTNSIDQD